MPQYPARRKVECCEEAPLSPVVLQPSGYANYALHRLCPKFTLRWRNFGASIQTVLAQVNMVRIRSRALLPAPNFLSEPGLQIEFFQCRGRRPFQARAGAVA